jgi:hypothetical protein
MKYNNIYISYYMINNYYSYKYNKYLKKNMTGGSLSYDDIIRYTNLINYDLGQNWCFTGSIALYLYCQICGIQNPYSPNDIDIVFVPDDCSEKPHFIANFSRKSGVNTNNGLPYYDNNGIKMLDLICSEEILYYEVNINDSILKLLSPRRLLYEYDNIFEDSNRSNLIIQDKIKLLNEIVLCIDPISIKKYKKPNRTITQNLNSTIQRPLFDDDDENNNNNNNNNNKNNNNDTEIPIRQPLFDDDY